MAVEHRAPWLLIPSSGEEGEDPWPIFPREVFPVRWSFRGPKGSPFAKHNTKKRSLVRKRVAGGRLREIGRAPGARGTSPRHVLFYPLVISTYCLFCEVSGVPLSLV